MTVGEIGNKLDEAVNRIFLEFQESENIESGDLEPLISHHIEEATLSLANWIANGMDWQERWCKRSHYYEIYAPESDITFIMKRTYRGALCLSESISGYYYGEPTDFQTDKYKESGAVAKFD